MAKKSDKYSFGACKNCGLVRPLKNGICPKCEEKQPKPPEFFEDLFDEFKRD